jgi:hypothetical protein
MLYPKNEWRVQNWEGAPLPGFQGLPEFTFMCPNNPAARGAILAHCADLAQSGRYDGIFLDRMRYPSPGVDPVSSLGCFCAHCRSAALEIGLDLSEIRTSLLAMTAKDLLYALYGEAIQPVCSFLDFRQASITQFIRDVVEMIRPSGLEIGLDCFPPSLTRMVGQDLGALMPLANWTKIMVYGHAYGPASLPYELIGQVKWLMAHQGIDESEAVAIVAEIIDLPIPIALSGLREVGLSSRCLALEAARGHSMGESHKLFTGIELVEISGVCALRVRQIESDLEAIKSIGGGGLSLSWDLWHIPLERLDIVRSVWS